MTDKPKLSTNVRPFKIYTSYKSIKTVREII